MLPPFLPYLVIGTSNPILFSTSVPMRSSHNALTSNITSLLSQILLPQVLPSTTQTTHYDKPPKHINHYYWWVALILSSLFILEEERGRKNCTAWIFFFWVASDQMNPPQTWVVESSKWLVEGSGSTQPSPLRLVGQKSRYSWMPNFQAPYRLIGQ